jgi:hypothetical protein
MDARLRSAVDASVGWYEDPCALHGVGSSLVDGLWSTLHPPPSLHSDAVVVEPEVTADLVLARLDGRDHCGVKDSFATMDPAGHGMELVVLSHLDPSRSHAGQATRRACRMGYGDQR